jgi:hypothetical protein
MMMVHVREQSIARSVRPSMVGRAATGAHDCASAVGPVCMWAAG